MWSDIVDILHYQSEPKFKVGQRVVATWMGGGITTHTIKRIEDTSHGYWYVWDDISAFDGREIENGLHECYLSAE